MQSTQRNTAIVAGALLLVSAQAFANCKTELAKIDHRLAGAEIDPHMAQVLKTFRDQGAAACKAGNETSASASFTAIEKILESQATASAPATQPETAAPQPAADAFTLSDAETVYINETGEGILRYKVPGGTGHEYTLVTGAGIGVATAITKPFHVAS